MTQQPSLCNSSLYLGAFGEQKLLIYCCLGKNPKNTDEINTNFFDVWIIPTLICI